MTNDHSFLFNKEAEKNATDMIFAEINKIPKFDNDKPIRALTFIDVLHETSPNSIRGKNGPGRLVDIIRKYDPQTQPELFLLSACWAPGKGLMEDLSMDAFFASIEENRTKQETTRYYENALKVIIDTKGKKTKAPDHNNMCGPNSPNVRRRISKRINVINKQYSPDKPVCDSKHNQRQVKL
ncbi:MAG: hypothetical protein WC464_01685 [Bdellovibrionales bacterium]